MPRISCVKTRLSSAGRVRDKQKVGDRSSMCQEKEKNGGFYVMLMPTVVGGAR